MKIKNVVISYEKGAPGFQAQLAGQGVFVTPESADAMAQAEGDRQAIFRLMVHGYFPESIARSLVFMAVAALLKYPLSFEPDAQEGGGK